MIEQSHDHVSIWLTVHVICDRMIIYSGSRDYNIILFDHVNIQPHDHVIANVWTIYGQSTFIQISFFTNVQKLVPGVPGMPSAVPRAVCEQHLLQSANHYWVAAQDPLLYMEIILYLVWSHHPLVWFRAWHTAVADCGDQRGHSVYQHAHYLPYCCENFGGCVPKSAPRARDRTQGQDQGFGAKRDCEKSKAEG